MKQTYLFQGYINHIYYVNVVNLKTYFAKKKFTVEDFRICALYKLQARGFLFANHDLHANQ